MMEKRTGARPMVVDGITFHCYKVGLLTYYWKSEDRRYWAHRPDHIASYRAAVDGKWLPTKFRSLQGAMRGAIKAGKQ